MFINGQTGADDKAGGGGGTLTTLVGHIVAKAFKSLRDFQVILLISPCLAFVNHFSSSLNMYNA